METSDWSKIPLFPLMLCSVSNACIDNVPFLYFAGMYERFESISLQLAVSKIT